MFQFTGFAPITRWYVFNISGCPIRISTDQFICANPRSFSQLITSFIASESLGIHHTPLFSFLCFLLFIIVLNVHCCTNRIIKIWLSIILIFTISFFQYVNELFLSFQFLVSVCSNFAYCKLWLFTKIVENIGVEPMTSCVQGRRSSQLS